MSAPLKGYLRNLSTERIGVKVRRIKNTYTFELCTDEGSTPAASRNAWSSIMKSPFASYARKKKSRQQEPL